MPAASAVPRSGSPWRTRRPSLGGPGDGAPPSPLASGVGLANEPGSLSWNEQLSRDFEGSKAFYRAVFGYDYQDMSSDGFTYAMLMVDGHEVGGIGEYPAGTPDQMTAAWTAYFQVTDVDAAVAKVTELGGTVVQPLQDTPYGRIGVVADNHGAVFSLITSPTA